MTQSHTPLTEPAHLRPLPEFLRPVEAGDLLDVQTRTICCWCSFGGLRGERISESEGWRVETASVIATLFAVRGAVAAREIIAAAGWQPPAQAEDDTKGGAA